MSTTIVLAVLCAALLHASWNALVKGGRDVLMDTALIAGGCSLVALPLLPWVPLPGAQQWRFLLMSMTIHVGYYSAMTWTYRHGDLSLGYPVMRGCAPLFVALAGGWLLGDAPVATAWAGILLVSGGVIVLALGRITGSARVALAFALLNAAIIAAYTLVDAAGVRQPGSLAGYLVWMFFVQGLPFAVLVAWRRGRAFVDHARAHWHRALAGGAASGASYGIALWATTQAPVGSVVALRETSVVFAALIGRTLLGERIGRLRWAGIGLVLVGVGLIRSAK